MASNFERFNKLQNGPLTLPRTITGAAKTIRLFMAYLDQPATHAAIMETANDRLFGGKANGQKVQAAIFRLNSVGPPTDHDKLRQLVALAPDLSVVSWHAWHVKDRDVLPERALIPSGVTEACMETYHRWIEALSRARG